MPESRQLTGRLRPHDLVKVWCFSGGAGMGVLTDDEGGALLPGDLGPWRQIATLTLTDEHEDDREARRLIREHGFVCFDERSDGEGPDG